MLSAVKVAGDNQGMVTSCSAAVNSKWNSFGNWICIMCPQTSHMIGNEQTHIQECKPTLTHTHTYIPIHCRSHVSDYVMGVDQLHARHGINLSSEIHCPKSTLQSQLDSAKTRLIWIVHKQHEVSSVGSDMFLQHKISLKKSTTKQPCLTPENSFLFGQLWKGLS